MASVKVIVRVKGFSEGEMRFKKASGAFDSVVKEELMIFGNEAIRELKDWIYSRKLEVIPKRRRDGKPTLVDSDKYIESYQTIMNDRTASITATGMNDNMSNEDLAEKLEYGDAQQPARPHLRPLELWIENRLDILGDRIAKGLFPDGDV